MTAIGDPAGRHQAVARAGLVRTLVPPRTVVRFDDLLRAPADAADADGFLGVAPVGAAQGEAHTVAEIFNAEGFFPDAAGESAAAEPARSPTLPDRPVPTLPAAPAPATIAAAVTAAGSSGVAAPAGLLAGAGLDMTAPVPGSAQAATADSVPGVLPPSGARGAGLMAAASVPRVSEPADTHILRVPDASGRPGGKAIVRLLARSGAVLNSRVTLAAIEHGCDVAVRVQGLDRAERGRLRARIAALLARHGLTPGDISLNGATHAIPPAKEQ